MATRSIHHEVCIAIRNLLASVPSPDSSARRRADYQIRKAEVLDMIAATEPHLAACARELAALARDEAQILGYQH